MERRERTPPRSDARAVAHEILLRVEQTDAFADVLLATRLAGAGLAPVDQALATRLVYGTIAWQGRLDFHLAALADRPLGRIDPPALAALRLGLFQLLFLDRVPAHAAVDASVRLAGSRASGFVNAVLRRAVRLGRTGLAPPSAREMPDLAARLAIEWSHPRWLVERWLAELGEDDTRGLLAADQEAAGTVVRANRPRATRETLAAELAQEQIVTAPARWAPDALAVEHGAGRLRTAAAWREGRLAFQSEASQLVAQLLAPEPGATVLDACAAPGGKSVHAATLAAGVRVLALDPHLAGARRVAGEAARLGVPGVRAVVADARRPPVARAMDAVLVDAPCTGLGTLRRHPELRWRRGPDDVTRLAALQRDIVCGVAPLVRAGGVLVYAVCTLTRAEAEDVVAAVRARHPRFAVDDARAFVPPELVDAAGALRTLPHRHGLDGFFAVRLRAHA